MKEQKNNSVLCCWREVQLRVVGFGRSRGPSDLDVAPPSVFLRPPPSVLWSRPGGEIKVSREDNPSEKAIGP
jgi:hypothetical protein